jgi:signal transduction histidine kinase
MKTSPRKFSLYFPAPTFEGDESKALIARIMHVVLWILLAMMVLAVFMATTGKVRITNRVFFNFSLIVGPLMMITLLIALRKGYVGFVAWTLVSFQWLSTVVQVMGSKGIESPAIGAFIVTILLAGFLIDRKGAVIFGTLSVISIFGIGYLEYNNLIPEPIVFTALPAKLLMLLSTIGVATVLLYMVIRTLQDALNRSRSYALELEQVIQQKTQAEQEISVLNQQLQRQVAELERFTYTVSHDLRSPLVTIKGFLGILNRDMESNRPDRVQHDFQRISNAADKMDALLSDLLELSRIGRIANPPEEVNLTRLVEEAVEMLDARIRSKNIVVKISPELPTIYGDRIRLREVFENLIDNAAKYMGDQTNPQIEVDAREDNVIFVKDNGMGIEASYTTRIFGLFEKLNPTSEGTGIGLALIKRIIEVHGGKIWVESEGLGRGSTFCFTIPGHP